MYTIKQKGKKYAFLDDGQALLTPMGNPVVTAYKSLADRLLADLNTHGDDPSDPVSLVAFHYAMIDFFSTMPREDLELSIVIGLSPESDWTFHCPTAEPQQHMKWMNTFGTYSVCANEAVEWLATLSRMQLCAVCIIGRALESVNIPFIVAVALQGERDLKSFARSVNKYYPYVSTKDLKTYFDNYLFYYGVEKAE